MTPDEPDGVWDVCSRVWRGVLFHTGMIIRMVSTDEYFVCLGFIGKLPVALWRVHPMKIARSAFLAFAAGTGAPEFSNSSPTLVCALDLDEFEAVPTKIVSPLQLYIANKKRVG